MTTEKIYYSLVKQQRGTYVEQKQNAEGKTVHILLVNNEYKEVADSTFKRWWKLVEEVAIDEVKIITKPQKEEDLSSKVKTKQKEEKIQGICKYFLQLVEEKQNCEAQIYSEGRQGVVKVNKKPTMFFTLLKNGTLKIYLKEELDSVINCPYLKEEKHSYPKRFPFRIYITKLENKSKELLSNILDLYS